MVAGYLGSLGMASVHTRMMAIVVFTITTYVVLAGYLLATARPMTVPEWQFALETYAFEALAAALGFAVTRCRSALRALFAVPIAVALTLLVPRALGIWLSQSFHSVALNVAVLGLLFAIAGAAAGWSVAGLSKLGPSHA